MINAWVLYRKVKISTMPLVEFKASVATTIMQLNGNNKKQVRPSLAKENTLKQKRVLRKVA